MRQKCFLVLILTLCSFTKFWERKMEKSHDFFLGFRYPLRDKVHEWPAITTCWKTLNTAGKMCNKKQPQTY